MSAAGQHRSTGTALAIPAIVAIVAASLGVEPDLVIAPRERKGPRSVVIARQVAAYLAVTVYDQPASRVAPAFLRHRSTIDHALRCVEDWRDDPEFDATIEGIEARLTG